MAEIDEHVGCAVSGLTADARTLVDHGRVQAQQHRFSYNEPMPTESVTQALCDLALRFGEDDDDGGGGGMVGAVGWWWWWWLWWGVEVGSGWACVGGGYAWQRAATPSAACPPPTAPAQTPPNPPPPPPPPPPPQSRPFGVALLLAGWDASGPRLYQTDPSGTYVEYGARAIGSGSEGAQTALQEAWKDDMSLAEAEVLALATLKQVTEGEGGGEGPGGGGARGGGG